MIVDHLESTHVSVLQRHQLELNHFPKLNNTIDFLLHLSFVLGNFTNLLNRVLVVENSQQPQFLQLQLVVDHEVLLDSVLHFLPVTTVGSDHGVVLQVSDHRDEDRPTLDFFRDPQESVAFPVCDFDRLQSSSHFFDFILHFSEVHFSPVEFEIVIEPVLAFLDMDPQFFHPSDLDVDVLDDFLAAVGFAFLELEHLLVVNILGQPSLILFHLFLVVRNTSESTLHSSVIGVEELSLQLEM